MPQFDCVVVRGDFDCALMFTGIVEETGTIAALHPRAEAWRMTVNAHRACQDLELGDSIAVDGCCLTAVEFSADTIHFDLLEETLRLTRFGDLRAGARVNLERSLRYAGKIGGHFVSGHIDALGTVEIFEARGADRYLRVKIPPHFAAYIVFKGSIAVNGVSLTVAEALPDGFAVWLIPHTLERTNLGELSVGDRVQLEFDLLAKYVERLLPGQRSTGSTGPHGATAPQTNP